MNLMGQERWVTIPTCDQSRPTRLTNIINANLEASIPGFPEPTTHNQNQNFIMFVGDSSSGDSVRFFGEGAAGRRFGVSIEPRDGTHNPKLQYDHRGCMRISTPRTS